MRCRLPAIRRRRLVSTAPAVSAASSRTPAAVTPAAEIETAEKEIQKLTDQYIAKIDQHLAHKEKEIMTV